MTRAAPRDPIAFAACPICGARVAHYRNSVGRIYAYCHGNDDAAGKACGSDWRFGRTHSENFVRKAAAASPPAPPAADQVSDAKSTAGPDAGKPDGDSPPGERPKRNRFDLLG